MICGGMIYEGLIDDGMIDDGSSFWSVDDWIYVTYRYVGDDESGDCYAYGIYHASDRAWRDMFRVLLLPSGQGDLRRDFLLELRLRDFAILVYTEIFFSLY